MKVVLRSVLILLGVSPLIYILAALSLGKTNAGYGVILLAALIAVGIAVVISLILAGIYWLVKRRLMPGLSTSVWLLWGLFTIINFVNVLRYT